LWHGYCYYLLIGRRASSDAESQRDVAAYVLRFTERCNVKGEGKMRKTHLRSLRLFINAGMAFPECVSGAAALDLDAARWEVTGDMLAVTCRNCRKAIKRNMDGRK
jgi:hypothetical protein